MTVRSVLRYPDPVLKRRARSGPGPIEDLARDLVDTMRAGPATVGLAAPQIGESVRAFVLDVSGHRKAPTSHGLLVLFDPEILDAEGSEVAREGCLSVPDLTADVRRAYGRTLPSVVASVDAARGVQRSGPSSTSTPKVSSSRLDAADVRRALRVTVAGTDPSGERRTLTMEGFEARALQHELDHLDGTLILDRVDSASSLFPRKVYL